MGHVFLDFVDYRNDASDASIELPYPVVGTVPGYGWLKLFLRYANPRLASGGPELPAEIDEGVTGQLLPDRPLWEIHALIHGRKLIAEAVDDATDPCNWLLAGGIALDESNTGQTTYRAFTSDTVVRWSKHLHELDKSELRAGFDPQYMTSKGGRPNLGDGGMDNNSWYTALERDFHSIVKFLDERVDAGDCVIVFTFDSE